MSDIDTLYPEHAKLARVKALSQPLGEFLDWLTGGDFAICEWVGQGDKGWVREKYVDRETGETHYEDVSQEHLTPVRKSPNDWLALYFNIDLVKLDQEKEKMYKSLVETR